jgi:hypothetical protein
MGRSQKFANVGFQRNRATGNKTHRLGQRSPMSSCFVRRVEPEVSQGKTA